MRNIFLIFGVVIILFASLRADAKTNLLHSITLEKIDGTYNIVLDVDNISKVSRKVESDNSIILELSGITSSDTVNALYKGSAIIENLVIENSGFNKLKIYISAPNIKSADVILQPVSGSIPKVEKPLSANRIVWGLLLLAILSAFIKRSAHKTQTDSSVPVIRHNIKEREIELYRKYKSSLDTPISLHAKSANMKNVLRKIDRRIDDRLSILSK